jgi:hypothetical protein
MAHGLSLDEVNQILVHKTEEMPVAKACGVDEAEIRP